MAGKPLEEDVRWSGSWLDRQPFSAGDQAGWHAGQNGTPACVLAQARAQPQAACGRLENIQFGAWIFV